MDDITLHDMACWELHQKSNTQAVYPPAASIQSFISVAQSSHNMLSITLRPEHGWLAANLVGSYCVYALLCCVDAL